MENIASEGQRNLTLHSASSALWGLLKGMQNHNHCKEKIKERDERKHLRKKIQDTVSNDENHLG